jgi:hypothetical protein
LCLTSRPLDPQPMFVGLVAAAMKLHFNDNNLPDAVNIVQKICS